MVRKVLTLCGSLSMIVVLGCPFAPPPEAILAGDWETTGQEGSRVVIRFDANGIVVGLLGEQDGQDVLVLVEGATTTLDGQAVSVTIPTPTGAATFTGLLSLDANTMTGILNETVEVSDQITVIIPQGDLTLTRVGLDPCEGVTCDPGEECVDGECVAVDPCDGVTCDPGEECVDGECVAIDPCEGVTCDPGEECVDGECVATDPCEGVTCDPGEECVDGECVATDPCEGVTCDPGEECVDGECVAIDPCEGVTCDPGEECVDGECVAIDPCEGVTCDPGEVCEDGVCVPEAGGGDPVAGEAFYFAEGCNACHGDNADDGFAPSLIGLDSQALLDKMDGTETHVGGTVDGVTQQDADDLAAWLDTL